MNRRAFTLIELLAVIVIVSMVAGMATIGLAAGGESARLQAVASRWQDLDARARVFAQSVGPVSMSLQNEGKTIDLGISWSNELLGEVAVPVGVTAGMEAEQALLTIQFDARGRTVDYMAKLQSDDRLIRWQVYGLTGFIVELER